MATANTMMDIPDIHTTAGARFLAPFMTAILLVVFGLIAMLVHPYITG